MRLPSIGLKERGYVREAHAVWAYLYREVVACHVANKIIVRSEQVVNNQVRHVMFAGRDQVKESLR